MKRFKVIPVLLCALVLAAPAVAQVTDGAGARAGIGTDISGGIAFGAELNYTKGLEANALQLAFAVFGGSFEETSDNDFNTYEETTDILVIGVMANYLFEYAMDKSGPYFVLGTGFGVVSVEWKEESATDTSLGTPLPGGGSKQEEDGSAGGTIFNLGIGHRFSEQFDLRFQVPTFVIFDPPGESSGVIPTFSVTAGLQF